MMTERTLLVLIVCRPVCDITKNPFPRKIVAGKLYASLATGKAQFYPMAGLPWVLVVTGNQRLERPRLPPPPRDFSIDQTSAAGVTHDSNAAFAAAVARVMPGVLIPGV